MTSWEPSSIHLLPSPNERLVHHWGQWITQTEYEEQTGQLLYTNRRMPQAARPMTPDLPAGVVYDLQTKKMNLNLSVAKRSRPRTTPPSERTTEGARQMLMRRSQRKKALDESMRQRASMKGFVDKHSSNPRGFQPHGATVAQIMGKEKIDVNEVLSRVQAYMQVRDH